MIRPRHPQPSASSVSAAASELKARCGTDRFRCMATMITDECINCGACEPECPNTAIYQGGVQWDALDGSKQAAISDQIFYIVPEKCTECVGFFDHEACAAVCPVDCCIPNPSIPETEAVLIARAAQIHPDKTFGGEF